MTLSTPAINTLLRMASGERVVTFELPAHLDANIVGIERAGQIAAGMEQLALDILPYLELAQHGLVMQTSGGPTVAFIIQESGKEAAKGYQADGNA